MNPTCPFCNRIRRGEYEMAARWGVVRFEPLNPVTPGHMLFLPGTHFEHPAPHAVGEAMECAEQYAQEKGGDFNLITSSGPAATQTIAHLHIHYVPRREDDGLTLPWTGQKRAENAATINVEIKDMGDAWKRAQQIEELRRQQGYGGAR